MKSIRFALVTLALTVASSSPALSDGPPIRGYNAQIGTDTGVHEVSIGWERSNGYLFALLDYDSGLNAGDWRLFRSTDGGRSWGMTASNGSVYSNARLAVVGPYVYVVYTAGTELRVRRASSTTGLIDSVYGYRVAFDSAPSTITEVALAANSDDNDNTLWIFALTDAHVVHAFACTATDCTTFPSQPTGVTDASRGLDATWNGGYPVHTPSDVWVLFSYVTTDHQVRVVRRQSNVGWTVSNVQPGDSLFTWTTSLAAYRDHFAVAFSVEVDGLVDNRWAISHVGGSGWWIGTLGDASALGSSFHIPMVNARSRSGFGLLQQWDNPSGIDRYWQGEGRNYGISVAFAGVNDHDFYWGGFHFTSDFEWLGSGWGTAYVCEDSKAWFTWSSQIRYSGFEVGGLDEWDVVSP